MIIGTLMTRELQESGLMYVGSQCGYFGETGSMLCITVQPIVCVF